MTPEEQRKAIDIFDDGFQGENIHEWCDGPEIMQARSGVFDFRFTANEVDVIRAALSAPAVQQWQPIETAPVGSNEQKNSHFIGINKWGNVSRCYRIHNGAGPYAMHNPWYNNYGQDFIPIGWMPLPPPPIIDEVKE